MAAQQIVMTQTILNEIRVHAQKDAPNESCGYILGTEDNARIAKEYYPMTNADHSPEHFQFIPKEQFAAVRYGRERDLAPIAVVHSHPASAARPSQEDIRLAIDTQIAYLIFSVPHDELRAYKIVKGEVHSLEIEWED